MNTQDLLHLRLMNQQLLGEQRFEKPEEIVAYQGAMQAQEYAHAKWAISLRIPGQTDASVEQAFNEGRILRTHLMRPTWHLVAPEDIRWLQNLTAHRVHAFNAYQYRQTELTEPIFKKAMELLERALEGGKCLTRDELAQVLEDQGIVARGIRLACILMYAELECLLCSGPRAGKQFTYALLGERAPQAKALPRDEALQRVTRRYFTTRGPATVQDMAWWSGLTMKDVREGIALAGKELEKTALDGKEYWMGADRPESGMQNLPTFLMPDYDEYSIAYRDRTGLTDRQDVAGISQDKPRNNAIFNHMLVVEGLIRGTWRQAQKAKSVTVEAAPYSPLNEKQKKAVATAIKRYAAFLGKTAEGGWS
jgi:hypothetical protein